MAEMQFLTNLNVTGPWLLERSALDELDTIIEREYSALKEQNDKELRDNVEKEIKSRNYQDQDERDKQTRTLEKQYRAYFEFRCERIVTVSLPMEKQLVGGSISEVARHPALTDVNPGGLVIFFRVGQTDCRFKVASDRLDPRAELAVSSKDPKIQNDLFAVLREWMDKTAPPKWQQLWYRVGVIPLWALLIILIAVVDGILASLQLDNPYRQEAHALLRQGISPATQVKAIGLLLALASDYRPPLAGASPPFWLEIAGLGFLVVCSVLSIGPKAVIGLGRGESRIRLWRRWLNAAFFVVPLWLLSTVVAAFISNFLVH